MVSADEHPPIQVVDENDTPLRGGTMDEVQLNGLWHRITGVMIQDTERQRFLLQKVTPNPYYSGGKWNLTSTGHVDEGETYDQAARRELFEEMGVEGMELREWSRYQTEKTAHRAGEDRTYRRHWVIFTAEADMEDLEVQPNTAEVEQASWFSLEELRAMRSSDMTDTLRRFVESVG